jgi:hypothetical protein
MQLTITLANHYDPTAILAESAGALRPGQSNSAAVPM